MIYSLTANSSLDHHVTVKKLIKDDRVTAQTVRIDAGGKGINVSRVVQELAGRTKAFAVVGGEQGGVFKKLIGQQKISCAFCEVRENTRTNLKITDLSDASHVQINESGPRLSKAEIEAAIAMVERVKPRPSYWVLAGSLPPGVPDGIYKRLITSFQKRGERCVLDADGAALKLGIEARPFLIKPNQYELERLLGKKLATLKQIVASGQQLARKAEIVAITLGPKGAVVVSKGRAWHVKGPAVKVKSHVGAGDTFIGGFLTALDRGKDVETASRWGVAAATVSVMSEGTAHCERREVERMVGRVKATAL